MPETDWIIRGDKLVIKKEAQFNMIELYITTKILPLYHTRITIMLII